MHECVFEMLEILYRIWLLVLVLVVRRKSHALYEYSGLVAKEDVRIECEAIVWLCAE